MYGDSITLIDALVITLFSMGLVFVALVVLSYSIDGIAGIINRGEKKKTETVPVVQEEQSEEEETDDQELIAVISAAVACASGKSLNSFFVRSVRRSGGRRKRMGKSRPHGRYEIGDNRR